MNNKIVVYVLTHNRPQLLQRALDSIMRQTVDNFDIVISDNSDNLDTYNIYHKIGETDKRIHYRHYKGIESSNKHFNYILVQNNYDFFMLFHDDDVMMPNMVENLFNEISIDESAVAVGCNAYLNVNGTDTIQKFNKSIVKRILKTPSQVIEAYSNSTISPFPAYMYRKKRVQGMVMDFKKGGKYCDVSFIVELTNCGSLIILPDSYMYYYISNLQDSHIHSFTQYISLTNYLRNKYKCKKTLINLRISNIYNELKQEQINKGQIAFRKRDFRILLKYSFTNYFVKYLLRLFNLYR